MYQKITIVGNLGNDPQMRYTPSGQAVCNFSVATNRRYTNSNGQQVDETAWFRVSTWGKLAEVCNQYLRKGRKVLVEGRLIPDPATGGPRIWTGNDGQPRASFEVTALEVKFLSSRAEDAGMSNDMAAPPAEEDIPF
ncbi:MAG: single-stranded DNA-binding protein [Anaerolineae bacterium]|nr:MAG: single-stranded DNA-binding protein [Anaerolineae bacterium]